MILCRLELAFFQSEAHHSTNVLHCYADWEGEDLSI